MISKQAGNIPSQFSWKLDENRNLHKIDFNLESTFTRMESESTSIPLTSFIKIYFDATYFLCISPFHLRLNRLQMTPLYSATSWWLQKVACGVLTLLACLWMIREVRLSIPGDAQNPVAHFRFVMAILNCVFKLIIIKLFWTGQGEIVKLVNFILENNLGCDVHHGRKFFTEKRGAFALILIYTGMALGSVATWTEIYKKDLYQFELTWRGLMDAGRINIFLPQDFSDASDIISIGFGILAAIEFYQRTIFGLYSDLFILMVVLTLHMAAKSLALSLPRNEDETSVASGLSSKNKPCLMRRWLAVKGQFKALKRLSRMINKIVGTNITCMISYAILFSATSLDTVFITEGAQNYFRVMKAIFLYLDLLSVFLVSANTCHQVCPLKLKKSYEIILTQQSYICKYTVETNCTKQTYLFVFMEFSR